MRITPVAIALLAGLTAACDGPSSVRITTSTSTSDEPTGVLKVVDALQCPETMGSLTRKGAVAEGATCLYAGPKGSEVALHLVKLESGQNVRDVLREFETRLSNQLPEAAARMTPPKPPQPPASPSSPDAPANSGDSVDIQAPGMTIRTQGEDASVRLPGLRIESQGENAQIRIGGLRIRADDDNATVNVTSTDGKSETVDVQAHDGAAQVRVQAPGAATRATYVLTNETPSVAGWRLVGYEARGPVGGPIIVATVRSKERDREPIFDDARELVELNVGK